MQLELPLVSRLEAIDSQHPNTVAVMRGPLVLFALKPLQTSPMPSFGREFPFSICSVFRSASGKSAAETRPTVLFHLLRLAQSPTRLTCRLYSSKAAK